MFIYGTVSMDPPADSPPCTLRETLYMESLAADHPPSFFTSCINQVRGDHAFCMHLLL